MLKKLAIAIAVAWGSVLAFSPGGLRHPIATTRAIITRPAAVSMLEHERIGRQYRDSLHKSSYGGRMS